jgi:hypothetical protein
MRKPNNVFQLSLSYIEGFIFSVAFFLGPLINIRFFEYFIGPFLVSILVMGGFAAFTRRRIDLIYYAPLYFFLVAINAYIFLEQFWLEIIRKKTNLVWFQPKRREMLA